MAKKMANCLTQLGPEHSHRILVETMNDGAATLTYDGTILYCNRRLAAMLQVSLESLVGTPLSSYMASADQAVFAARLLNLPEIRVKSQPGIGSTFTVLLPICEENGICNNEYLRNSFLS